MNQEQNLIEAPNEAYSLLLPPLNFSGLLLCCLFLSLLFLLFKISSALYTQYSVIAFYEQQGIKVFPGARRPLVGNLMEHLAYKTVRMSKETVPVKFQWLL